jgi:hypothetical protein
MELESKKMLFNRGRPVTPLTVICLFLSSTEIATGFAVTKTSGPIQIAVTVFALLFPIAVATVFFIILWHRPINLYAPNDFGSIDIKQFAEAVNYRQKQVYKLSNKKGKSMTMKETEEEYKLPTGDMHGKSKDDKGQ